MYEVKLGTRATRQVEKLDPHKHSFLSDKYSGLRRVAFSTPAGEDKRRVVVLFVGSRENFYKELQRYLG
ncbi:hypothetical protein KAT45_04320 [Candidatus Aerophobetes bacterium]|nr:hypothetical protein [Candidatus Aerophobetes bacterium]